MGVPSQLSDIVTKFYTHLFGLLLLQWVPTQYLWTITPACMRRYLESKTIAQMACPAGLPDANPIEQVGKTDCRPLCAARLPPRAPTTATTSDQ
ncbi:hypothetical protein AVEN_2974-1 [Araneus ventricosus]|uniref:Uncharacterized protein n=1 Tax=Araneus ventricosus TaxID=182803 RepID=A0A4Y2RRE4_ARAVE|nr:hypothetical protein AVEN_2974-1 [Araneus ventricosus]